MRYRQPHTLVNPVTVVQGSILFNAQRERSYAPRTGVYTKKKNRSHGLLAKRELFSQKEALKVQRVHVLLLLLLLVYTHK